MMELTFFFAGAGVRRDGRGDSKRKSARESVGNVSGESSVLLLASLTSTRGANTLKDSSTQTIDQTDLSVNREDSPFLP